MVDEKQSIVVKFLTRAHVPNHAKWFVNLRQAPVSQRESEDHLTRVAGRRRLPNGLRAFSSIQRYAVEHGYRMLAATKIRVWWRTKVASLIHVFDIWALLSICYGGRVVFDVVDQTDYAFFQFEIEYAFLAALFQLHKQL